MNFKSKVVKFSAAILGTVAFGTFAAATSASADTIYTVQAGDTLSEISYKYANDLSLVDTLAQKNNIADKNLIVVGQKLIIKDDGEIRPATQAEVESTPAANSSAATSSNSSNTAAASSSSTASQATTSSSSNYTSSATGNDASAKAWIAARESGNSYSARNGQYIGKYQLSSSYLGGDYSAANQERVADNYVTSRYGSWSNAQAHWISSGWY
ncbi:aggregation-promoting factor [Paucilactobacillus sp. N302-9]